MNPYPNMAFPTPKQALQRFALHAKKSFGQNFLADAQLVDRIAALAGDSPAQVVEIGAGLGGLTYSLLMRGHQVTAVERDRDMIPVLQELLGDAIECGQLRLLEADAKQIQLAELFKPGQRRILMGNLPYQITGPLLENSVHARADFDRAVFLVQKEVAERLTAPPGGKTYGALSVFCQAAFKIQRAFLVRRGAFYPQPNVDSAVITLDVHAAPRAEETEAFRALVRGAFHERRKTLRNAWQGVLGLNREALQAIADTAGVSLDARGETLSVEDFWRMTQEFERRQAPSGTRHE